MFLRNGGRESKVDDLVDILSSDRGSRDRMVRRFVGAEWVVGRKCSGRTDLKSWGEYVSYVYTGGLENKIWGFCRGVVGKS